MNIKINLKKIIFYLCLLFSFLVQAQESVVTLYKDSNYKGKSISLNVGEYGPKNLGSVGNDNVSSFKILKDDIAVEICVHYDDDGKRKAPCRIYTKSMNNLREFNDEVSYLRVFKVNPNYFTYIFASDSQFYWAQYDKSGQSSDVKKEQSKRNNKDHVLSMNKIKKENPNSVLGVILNGDLTAYGHGDQLEIFRDYYGLNKNSKHHFTLELHPMLGLGNHDYANNVKGEVDGKKSEDGCFWNGCARDMIALIRDEFIPNNPNIDDFDKESLAYSWSYRDVVFVQLHNYPTYWTTFDYRVLGTFWSATEKIKKSIPWLKKVLTKATKEGKRIILNMHDFGDHMSANNKEFIDAITGQNVRAIFSGHIHSHVGYVTSVIDNNGNYITVYRTGSAPYNLFLRVDFYPDSIRVYSVDSKDGVPTYF